MKEVLIELHNISKSYGIIKALENISFNVQRGEIIGLLGPNGSGKTTTIRLICGVLAPDEGRILVKGLDPFTNGRVVRQNCGVITETAALYENMTVKQNLEFYAEIYNLDQLISKSRVDYLLKYFGLSEKQNQKVAKLSTGQKKRLALAKALLHDPELLFLDEPTASLDPEAARDVIELIQELNKEGKTIFVCTHNLREAEVYCRRFLFLDRGRIIANGSQEELEKIYNIKTDLLVSYKGEIPTSLKEKYPYQSKNLNQAIFSFESRQLIPNFIKELALTGISIYEIQSLTNKLEELYFRIREKND